MKRHLCGSAFAFVVIAIAVRQAHAQLPTLVRQIASPPPLISSGFGYSFNEFNGNLLVGATDSKKAAYLMNISTGAKLLTMTSPDADRALSFGSSVAQVGQNIAVGDYNYDASSSIRRSGAAYLFSGSTGQPLLTIHNPDPHQNDNFGGCIQAVGGKLWINSQSRLSTLRGMIDVFNPTTGQLTHTITNPDIEAESWGFGWDFLEHNNDVFVSAAGGTFGHLAAGAVYRYDNTTFELKQKIYNPVPRDGAEFGWSMADNDKYLLVGAPNMSTTAIGSGQAYLYNAKTGVLLQTFVNPDPQEFGRFGDSVALLGDYAIVGEPRAELDHFGGPQSIGAFYVFDVNTGDYLGRVFNPKPTQNAFFTDGSGNSGGLITIGDQLVAASYLNGLGSVFVYANPVVANDAVPIPEPPSLGLLTMGTLAVLWQRKRK